MEWLVKRAIHRYLKKHYPRHVKQIIARAKRIRPKLMAKAPDLGGRENSLSDNLNMFILFLSYYEATNHKMAGEAIDEIIADLYNHLKVLGKLMDINNPRVLSILRKYLYRNYQKYANKVIEICVHACRLSAL